MRHRRRPQRSRNDTAIRVDRSAHERVVAQQGRRVCLRVPAQETGAALDVREEERHDAVGQRGHEESIGREARRSTPPPRAGACAGNAIGVAFAIPAASFGRWTVGLPHRHLSPDHSAPALRAWARSATNAQRRSLRARVVPRAPRRHAAIAQDSGARSKRLLLWRRGSAKRVLPASPTRRTGRPRRYDEGFRRRSIATTLNPPEDATRLSADRTAVAVPARPVRRSAYRRRLDAMAGACCVGLPPRLTRSSQVRGR